MIVSNMTIFVLSVICSIKSERILTSDILHKHIINQYFRKRISWKTSNLGTIVFKNVDKIPKVTRESNVYTISIYKHMNTYKDRFMKYNNKRTDPLARCNVKNCKFIGRNSIDNFKSDAVLFYIFKGEIPKIRRSDQQQIWVFYSDESPINSFAGTNKKPKLTTLKNIFNWSMTYRSDSDVPVPYGRTVGLKKPIIPNYLNLSHHEISKLVPYWGKKRRDVLVTVLMSHCVPHRINYIDYLRKLTQIDFYGKCSHHLPFRNSCPGHTKADCEVITRYLFYLVLENSNCRQYMTEKLFYNAYSKGAIPVIRGTPLEDCEKLLPPHSFLHEKQFKTPEELVKAIVEIGNDDKKLLSYHRWRNHFEVTNEHGFFGSESTQLCRLCQALNYNDLSTKVYNENDIKLFLDEKILCNPNKYYKRRFVKKKFIRKKVVSDRPLRTQTVRFNNYVMNTSLRILS